MQDGARPEVAHPVDIKILSMPVRVALSLLEYIPVRDKQADHLGFFGYGGYSKDQKTGVATKVVNNIFANLENPLENLSKEEMDILNNGDTGQRSKELIKEFAPQGSNRVSPNHSPRTSPPSGNRSPA